MKIEYLGHSCFKLTESTGTSVVCDPYDKAIGYELPPVAADAVTISHGHYDHDNKAEVAGTPIILDKECSYDLPGVEISSIKSFHDETRGKKRGENIIFKFRMDGIDVCHLGDLGEACSSELIENILPVNVLLIPVGGTYTIDAQMAKEYVDRIMPDIVIPMHYKTKSLKIDIDRVDEFLELFEDDTQITTVDGEVEILRDDLNGESTQIIVINRVK
ncbi:MAG: MBL fold metallo-hydrolase [Clostridia bacterium]|nr:MBL fold metallo-hydrolase [Clostridia bacterium]